MLTPKNSGKYLSKEYYRLRNLGLEDSRNLTTNDFEFADLSFPDGGGHDDESTYVLYSIYKSKKYDIRNSPGRE
jgi:hypothetical protein